MSNAFPNFPGTTPTDPADASLPCPELSGVRPACVTSSRCHCPASSVWFACADAVPKASMTTASAATLHVPHTVTRPIAVRLAPAGARSPRGAHLIFSRDHTPLLERDAERKAVSAAIADARHGAGQPIFIEGPAGAGKSA